MLTRKNQRLQVRELDWDFRPQTAVNLTIQHAGEESPQELAVDEKADFCKNCRSIPGVHKTLDWPVPFPRNTG